MKSVLCSYCMTLYAGNPCQTCHPDGAGELFIWSVLFFIEHENNDFTLALLGETQASDSFKHTIHGQYDSTSCYMGV